MKEIWKDVPGYENLYRVSNLGKIINSKGRILKQRIDHDGYLDIKLCKNGIEKRYKVHRLVAFAFINPNCNKPHINHIDCNKQNNSIDNLEWCTISENMKHAYREGLINPNNLQCQRPVKQINLEGDIIEVYSSIKNASIKTCIQATHIVKVCRNKAVSAGGYNWMYA